MKLTEEVQTRAEELQKECHEQVDWVMPKLTQGTKEQRYDICVTTWTFQKLAELDIRIKQLELEHGIR